MMMMMMTVQ